MNYDLKIFTHSHVLQFGLFTNKSDLPESVSFYCAQTLYINVPFFELNHRVCQHVAHVNLSSPSQDVGVFLLHEPTHVREKQPALRVVWVRVCLSELVVNTVVSHPIKDRVL